MKNPLIRHDLPVSVDAPIVLDATTQAGIQPLFDFIGGLESNTSEAVAAAEGKRLAPYFKAMSNYFQRALNATGAHQADLGPMVDSLNELTTPENLGGIFNAAARRTHNAMISRVTLLPSDVVEAGPASYLFKEPQFQVNYLHAGHIFNFGFLQVFEGGDKKTARSSTAMPTFLLDRKMMKAVAGYQPLEMLKGFQDVISWVNHDMLHHFTSPLINSHVAKKFSFDDIVKPEPKDGPIHTWSGTLPRASSYSYYEEWAQAGHEKVLLAPGNEEQTAEISKRIAGYFDELKRIGEDMARDKGRERAHEAVDYFGMVMAHALTRVFPLNHPVMTQCMEAMEKADPLPGVCLREARNMVPQSDDTPYRTLRKYFAKITGAKPPPTKDEDALAALRAWVDRVPVMARSVKSYRETGFDMLPADDAQVTYQNLKLLQLVKCSFLDIYPHMPKAPDKVMAAVRERTDRSMMGMVTAASKSYEYPPRSPSG